MTYSVGNQIGFYLYIETIEDSSRPLYNAIKSIQSVTCKSCKCFKVLFAKIKCFKRLLQTTATTDIAMLSMYAYRAIMRVQGQFQELIEYDKTRQMTFLIRLHSLNPFYRNNSIVSGSSDVSG